MARLYDELRALTADAIRKAKGESDNQPGEDRLFGFGLCTDEEVGSVYHAACSESRVKQKSKNYKDIGYISVEWQQSGSNDLFDAISKKIFKLA
jgi:hypothetical protein